MAKQFTLGKNERLKSRKAIEQLFSEGQRFSVSPFRVYYLFLPPTVTQSTSFRAERRKAKGNIQFGVGVSSKNFKKAVHRNRIKRLTRESYRLQKNPLHEKLRSKNTQLNLFFIYTGKELPEYDEINKKIGLSLSKLDKIVDLAK